MGKRTECSACSPYGVVKVSTGFLKQDKRVELQNLFKTANFKLNANDRVALAA